MGQKIKHEIFICASCQNSERSIADFTEVIEECVNATLAYEAIAFACQVNIILCENDYIKVLNHDYRGKDSITDVLSFPMVNFEHLSDYTPMVEDIDPESGSVVLGDMVLSIQRAKEQAAEYNHSLKREVGFLTLHSMLHLLGYDHENSEDEEKIMFNKQNEIMDSIGLVR